MLSPVFRWGVEKKSDPGCGGGRGIIMMCHNDVAADECDNTPRENRALACGWSHRE